MLMTKFIGEPYAGKPHVRFDEGAGKGSSPSRSTLPVKKVFFNSQLEIQLFLVPLCGIVG